jgi:hypothetical protein
MSRSSSFLALQCSVCDQIQIQGARRDGRFRCKVCGEWQSVRQVLAKASRAQDIRPFVQAANLARGEQGGALSRLPETAGNGDNQDAHAGSPLCKHPSTDCLLDEAILEALHEPIETKWDAEIARALQRESSASRPSAGMGDTDCA